MSSIRIIPQLRLLLLLSLFALLFLTGCSGSPLYFMPKSIGTLATFLTGCVALLALSVGCCILLSIFGLGRLWWLVEIILFVVVLVKEDYGFWMTLLLFIVTPVLLALCLWLLQLVGRILGFSLSFFGRRRR